MLISCQTIGLICRDFWGQRELRSVGEQVLNSIGEERQCSISGLNNRRSAGNKKNGKEKPEKMQASQKAENSNAYCDKRPLLPLCHVMSLAFLATSSSSAPTAPQLQLERPPSLQIDDVAGGQ